MNMILSAKIAGMGWEGDDEGMNFQAFLKMVEDADCLTMRGRVVYGPLRK